LIVMLLVLPRYSGRDCSQPSCRLTNGVLCSGQGTCTQPNYCTCDPGFSGPDCEVECGDGVVMGSETCDDGTTHEWMATSRVAWACLFMVGRSTHLFHWLMVQHMQETCTTPQKKVPSLRVTVPYHHPHLATHPPVHAQINAELTAFSLSTVSPSPWPATGSRSLCHQATLCLETAAALYVWWRRLQAGGAVLELPCFLPASLRWSWETCAWPTAPQ
jgi:hypothetical protein